jgi:hypothetical protein
VSLPLPGAIRSALGRLDRRLRAANVLRGLGTAALVAAVAAAVGMGADFLRLLPDPLRWALWGASLLAVFGALGWGVARPLARRADPLDLAAVAERAEPSLGEQLTAAVGLLGHGNGSPALIAALAAEAAARAEAIAPARAVSLRRAAAGLVPGAVALMLLAGPSLVYPGSFGVVARRFLAPWARLERVGRFEVTVAPGDRAAAVGEDVPVSARVRPRLAWLSTPGTAWLEWTSEGRSQRVAMPLDAAAATGGRGFHATLPALSKSITYRVVSGSSASRSYTIRAVAPPAVVKLSARVEPPAYTGLPAAPGDPARLEAWEGSRVVLDITANRPVRAVAVDWPGSGRPVAAVLQGDGKTARATLVAEQSGPFALSLRDADGLASRPEPPRRLVVIADAAPVVVMQGPGMVEPMEANPDDTLQAAVAARDDVAVASVELHYAIQRGGGGGGGAAKPETGVAPADVRGLGTRAVRGAVELALGPLRLQPGDVLTYRLRVADNRPAPRGPNVVWTPAATLAIADDAAPLREQQSRAARAALQAKLDALKRAAAANRQETEQLRYAADAAQRGNGTWDRDRQHALAAREAEARTLADRLQLLARELAADSRFHPLAPPARRIAEDEAESSRAVLEQALKQTDPALRLNDLRQADARLTAVSQRLDDLQRQFDALARRDADVQRLRTLAGREDDLADRAGQRGEDDTSRLRADQAEAARDLDSLLRDSPDLRAAAQQDQAKPAPSSNPLDTARQAMRQALAQLQRERELSATARKDRQAARQAMNRAAEALRAAAQNAAPRPGRPGDPEQAAQAQAAARNRNRNRDPKNVRAAPGSVDLTTLQALLRSKSGRAWGELPGHLRTEILQMTPGRYRDDYARLIQLYYQELATGAAGGRPPTP